MSLLVIGIFYLFFTPLEEVHEAPALWHSLHVENVAAVVFENKIPVGVDEHAVLSRGLKADIVKRPEKQCAAVNLGGPISSQQEV